MIKFFGLITLAILYMSNFSGVPQAVTRAPGESGFSCDACHTPVGNFVPSVSLLVLNSDSQVVQTYNPGQKYILKLQVTAENNPKSFGFQMVGLATATNNDISNYSMLGQRVKQINLNVGGRQRKYLEQSSAKVDGIFTANWTAPATDVGSIDFYYSGLAVNLNGSNSGDNVATGTTRLESALTSSIVNTAEDVNVSVYPNPVVDILYVDKLSYPSTIKITDVLGKNVYHTEDGSNGIDVSHLNNGLYFITIASKNTQITTTKTFTKS